MKLWLLQSRGSCNLLWGLLLVFVVIPRRGHSFQLTWKTPTSATISTRRISPYSTTAFCEQAIYHQTRNTALYKSTHEEDEAEAAVLGAKNATTALLMDEMMNETFEIDLGTAANISAAVGNGTTMDIAEAPPLSFQKFLTMQGKRVVVTIRYSGEAGLRPYFLTAAKKIKASHPDVILERRQMADLDKEDPTDEPTFEILVDGKVIVGNNKSRSRKIIGSVALSRSQSIFVSMEELDLAISRARRRRRPSTTVYGEIHEPAEVQSLRLDGLRQGTSIVKRKHHHEWND